MSIKFRRLTASCLAFVATAVAMGSTGNVASADVLAPLYAKWDQSLTSEKPGTSTGWTFDGATVEFPPGVQYPPQRKTTIVFPRGTRFDLKRVRNCTATDDEIVSGGFDACPARSFIGSGDASVFLGAAGIVEVEVGAFAARPGFGFAIATGTGTVLRVVRVEIDRNRLSFELPPIDLPGGYQAAFTRVFLETAEAGTRRHPLIRTPAKCPASGRWKFTYLPVYDEPYGVQRSTSTVSCKKR